MSSRRTAGAACAAGKGGFVPALLLAAACCAAAPAAAAEMFILENGGRRALVVQDEPRSEQHPRGGMIHFGDAKRFEKALLGAMPVSEVLFNSGGGSEADGLAIGRLIRRSGVSTRVPKGASCASACADAFMGGVARRVDEGGRYGIHMATVMNDPELIDRIFAEIVSAYDAKKETIDRAKVRHLIQIFEQGSAKAASRWGAYVLEMGGSPRIVDIGTNSKASQMNWLTREQMINLNVINVD